MIKLNIQRFASTNKTANYNLSQYIDNDKPSYLGDYNSDMEKIDSAMHTNATTISGVDSKAETAKTTATSALEKSISVESQLNNIYNELYPINTIVIKNDNNDYSNWLNFKWNKISQGKVLVGIEESDSDFDSIGKTGGEKKHTMTINELVEHTHVTEFQGNYGQADSFYGVASNTGIDGENVRTKTTGGSQPFNIMQPYQVVAYWVRVE